MVLLSFMLFQALYASYNQVSIFCPICKKQEKSEEIYLDGIEMIYPWQLTNTLECMHWKCRLLFRVAAPADGVWFDLGAQCKACKGKSRTIFNLCSYLTHRMVWTLTACTCSENRLGVARSCSEYEADRHQWVQFPLYFLNEAAYFNFLKESRFVDKKQILNFLLDDGGRSVKKFLRGQAGAKVLTSLARYASSFVMIDILVCLLSQFDFTLVFIQMWAIDSKGQNAIDYLSDYHIKILSEYPKEKDLLINFISKFTK